MICAQASGFLTPLPYHLTIKPGATHSYSLRENLIGYRCGNRDTLIGNWRVLSKSINIMALLYDTWIRNRWWIIDCINCFSEPKAFQENFLHILFRTTKMASFPEEFDLFCASQNKNKKNKKGGTFLDYGPCQTVVLRLKRGMLWSKLHFVCCCSLQ